MLRAIGCHGHHGNNHAFNLVHLSMQGSYLENRDSLLRPNWARACLLKGGIYE